MTHLVFRRNGAIGLSDEPWPESFEMPRGVDPYQVLHEARDETSALHRLCTFQAALIADFSSISRDSTCPIHMGHLELAELQLALGQRLIADAMRRVGTSAYGPESIAVLLASLLPLTIEITDWLLVRVRVDGERHILGYRPTARCHRASSPIRHFDLAARTATTSSGNFYVLVGEPCDDGLANPCLLAWLAKHGLTRHEIALLDMEDL